MDSLIIKAKKNQNNSICKEQKPFLLDKSDCEAITSLSAARTGVMVSNETSINLVGALIKTMYECGEINKKTLERSMEKLLMGGNAQ